MVIITIIQEGYGSMKCLKLYKALANGLAAVKVMLAILS